MNNKLATSLALSAAALFVGGCGKKEPTTPPGDATAASEADPAKKVKCYGVNECAGQTACGVTGKWDCGGNNDCCGKGWIQLAQAECDAKGGGQDESYLENVPGICDDKPDADGDAPADAGAETAPAATEEG